MTTRNDSLGCWLATPDIVFIEIASQLGYGALVLDVEHGIFSLADLDRLIPFARALGMRVLVKVEGPRAEPIQQALDFGAHGVIVPHILGAEHARSVCAAAKFPLLGTRSFAGARSVRYAAPAASYFDADNQATCCYPMVESREALAEVAQILALPTVDGVFVGPSDLSLSCGRGKYTFGSEDQADLLHIAEACRLAGKPWIMPTWRKAEQAFAKEHGAQLRIVIEQQAAMYDGLEQAMFSAV